jgi:hypothetical protein
MQLPTVAVHEIAQHPTSGEIVAATHGRSLWALDVTALRQMTQDVSNVEARLYRPNPAVYWRTEPRLGATLRRHVAENPSSDAQIYYSLGRKVNGARLRIKDSSGEVLTELETATEPGLHRATWNRRPEAETSNGRGRGRVEPGTYVVELAIGNQKYSESLLIQGDPEYPDAILWGETYEEQLREERRLQNPED